MGKLISIYLIALKKQKKKEEEKAKEKELNDLFKVAVSQPKVPAGNYHLFFFPPFLSIKIPSFCR